MVPILTIMPSGPMDTFRRFEVRFPMPIIGDYVLDIEAGLGIEADGRLVSLGKIFDGDRETEITSAFTAYNFIVTVEDQYGLVAQAGFDNGPLANETTILKSLSVRNGSTEALVNEGFYVPGFVNYSMDAPYDVASVRVDYETSEDFPDQIVTFSRLDRTFDLTQGETRRINFTVSYGNELPTPYVLSIKRMSPMRDSRLAGIYAEHSSRRYDTMPAFVSANIEQAYTIYVPSSVNSITLYADLPVMIPGDPYYDSDDWPIGSKVPSIVHIDGFSNEYPQIPYPQVGHSYKRVDGKWTLPLSAGSNLFYINVTPEAGMLSHYTLIVVRAPQTTDTAADISALSVTASGETVALAPAFTNGREDESYTANVSNARSSAVVSATVRNSGARITNFRTPSQPESLPITINGNTYSATLTGLEAGGSYPLTITVVSPDGVSHRDYHVLVNRMLPAAGGIAWVEEHRAVNLSWNSVNLGTSVPGSVSYELYYHTANIPNHATITSTAIKWGGVPGSSGGRFSATVRGLDNATRYYFWLRAMNGNIPGEWTPVGTSTVIQPRSNNSYLSSLSVSASGTVYPLMPQFNQNRTTSVGTFTAVVPNNTGSVTIAASGAEFGVDVNGVIFPTINFNRPETASLETDGSSAAITISPPGAGSSGTTTISVQAHDPNIAQRNYGLIIHRRLASPGWQPHHETNEQVTLSWNPVSGAAHYEVRYHTSDITDPANIAAEAVLFNAAVGGTSCVITGLENARNYYFWVRAVQTGIPVVNTIDGEWSITLPAMPKSNKVNLNGITISGGIPIVPLAFAEGTSGYSVIVPSSADSITVTGNKGEPNQTLAYTPAGGIVTPAHGGTANVQIGVTAHDGTARSAPYSVRVDRMLPGPVWASAPQAAPEKTTLYWNPLTGQTDSYEVFYRHDANNPPPSPPDTISAGPNWFENISGNSHEISGLINGQRYYFWVRGVVNGIPGEWSAAESAVPRSDAANLTDITVSGGTLHQVFSASTDNYVVDVPGGTGTVDITIVKKDEYQQINYTREGGTGLTLTPLSPLQDQYTITLSEGTSSILTLTVRSQDNETARTYKITMNRRPAAPNLSALRASVGRTVDLSWSAVAGAHAYELYYHDNSAVFSQPGFPDNAILWNGNISGTAETATVTGLTNNTPYYFWLRAKSASGLGGTNYSDWSAVASEKPLSHVAELASLTIQAPPAGSYLSPAFNPNIDTYYLITPNTSPITVDAVAADDGTLDDGPSHYVSRSLALNASHSFKVTSQNGNVTKTYYVYVQTAGVTVTFNLPGDINENLSLNSNQPISWTQDTTINVSLSSSLGGHTFQWYNGSVAMPGETGPTLATSARKFSLGRQTLTLRITATNGAVYSKSITFDVVR